MACSWQKILSPQEDFVASLGRAIAPGPALNFLPVLV